MEGKELESALGRRPLIYNIQRYSVQDGPGTRTTVFVKGCPLKCPWCHNPDAQDVRPELLFDLEKCTGCGACIGACPEGANRREGDKVAVNRALCTGCGCCVDVCPASAREICGHKIDMDDIVEEATKDEMFYIASGGGVTIGGGDPLFFPEFTLELTRRLKDRMLNVAIDTAAFCRWSYLDELSDCADLFLVDLKRMDSTKYRAIIGTDLEIVQRNLESLADKGVAIRVRIPVIPGFNDSEEDFAAFSSYLGKLGNGIEGVDILPFHAYASKKYKLSGRWEKYLFRDTETLQAEDVKGLALRLKQAGFSPANSRLTIGGMT